VQECYRRTCLARPSDLDLGADKCRRFRRHSCEGFTCAASLLPRAVWRLVNWSHKVTHFRIPADFQTRSNNSNSIERLGF
jgi:hypothetical protein